MPQDSSTVNSRKNLAMSTIQVVLVHDDQAAGAHHGADGDQVVIVDGGIDQLSGDAAAGGAAGLGSLELLAARHAAADFLHDFPQGGAHGDFHQAGVV